MDLGPCILFVFFVTFLVVVLVVAVTAVGTKQAAAQSYARLADHYGGKLQRGGAFEYPKVEFMHGRCRVAVDVYSTGGTPVKYFTRVKVALPQHVTRCEIYPDGTWARRGKLIGMDDVEIGVPGFDEQYVIKGSSRKELAALLNANVRRQIELIRRFLGHDGIFVSFERETLLVNIATYLREYHSLVRYVDLVLELVDLLTEVDDEGIEFVEEHAPPQVIGSICQICGEEIMDQVVFCRRCQTPHHLDCWHYYGACSTYGCREKKYLRPDSRRAQRAAKGM